MTSDAVAVRQACVTAAVDLARAQLVHVGDVLTWAARIERYARTGRIGAHAIRISVAVSTLMRKDKPAMAIQIPADFDARLHITTPVDRDGQPTTYGAAVTWESQNPDIFAAAAEQDDGLVGMLTTVSEGEGTLRLTTKAGPEADAPTLTLDVAVAVLPGDAVAINAGDVDLVRKSA